MALSAPLAILVLPMFDTTAAVIRRKLTGRGLATADRGHLHHVLMRNGLTAQRVLVIVGVLGWWRRAVHSPARPCITTCSR